MLIKSSIITLFFCSIFQFFLHAQELRPVFRHLTPANGLGSETVRGITQDKYGFMWFGSSNGLFRYDGVSMKGYYATKNDTTSLRNNMVLCLFNDSKGRLWIGQDPGFCMFDYPSGKFIHYPKTGAVYSITEDKHGNIWAATSRGLKIIDSKGRQLGFPKIKADSTFIQILESRINDISCDGKANLYAATGSGIIVINLESLKCSLISTTNFPAILKSNDVQAITVDSQDRLWFSTDAYYSMLYRLEVDHKSISSWNYFMQSKGAQYPNRILKLLVDCKNRLWVGCTFKGLSQYVEKENRFVTYINDPADNGSIAADFCHNIFQSKDGILWINTTGSGIDYFHPERTFFSAITKSLSPTLSLTDNWGRAIAEDDNGNLWLGTAQGVSVYHFQKGVIKNLINDDRDNKILNSTSIRSLCNGGDGTIWIGTSEGLNRTVLHSNRIITYSERDSLPGMFVHALEKLKTGNILVGGSKGLFEYQKANQTFINVFKMPQLQPFINTVVKCIREDSRGWWWLGTFGQGVLVFNPNEKKLIKLLNDSTVQMSNNTIHSFCEDEKGNMWIGTRDGLNYFDVHSGVNIIVGKRQGLQNTWISGMAMDKQNRLWAGTGNGLYVINGQHRAFHSFGMEDGLSTTAFNDQSAYVLKDGRFVFPSRKGFVYFDPELFDWKQETPEVYITALKAPGKELTFDKNIEDLTKINLRYNQNFFTVEMNGLHYSNPSQCWYAYKLEGFDKEWIYTKERVVNYTNVPGGRYTFRYKASTDAAQWDTKEKTLEINIGTVFYKQIWFLTLAILTLASLSFLLYRFRLSKQRRILELETKAHSLEKEKTQVQYENLKQQLNPHFLFNSLSSLRSLIRTNPPLATGFLDGLSKTYRYLLRSGDNELVALKEEISFVEIFVQLQKTRFEEGLQLKINLPEDLMNRLIAPVTIQGLIENAIKHNTIDEESPLVVEILADAENVVVRNNLQKIAFVETSNKKGLAALKTLYGYLTSRPITIKEDGTWFEVSIPLL